MFTLIAWFGFLVYQLPPTTGITWEVGDYHLPKRIVLGPGFSFNDNIAYIFDVRGESGDPGTDPAIYKLDTTVSNPSWQKLSLTIPFTSTIQRDQSCKAGDKIWFYHSGQRTFYIFDTTTDTFLDNTNIATSQYIIGSSGSVVSDDVSYIYTVGGQSATISPYVQQYDIANNAWNVLSTDAPYNRWFWLNTAVYPPQNRIYVFGGYAFELSADFFDIYYFDLDTNTWSAPIGTITTTRLEPIIYIPETDRIYIFSGSNGVSIYNPTANTYTLSSNSPTQVCGSSSYSSTVALNNRLQEFGGTSTGTNCRTEEIYSTFYSSTEIIYNTENCAGEPDSFDWDTLTGDGTNIPTISYEMSNPDDTLSLYIKVKLEYQGYATGAEGDGPFGVTYVLDFEDFDANEDNIYNPGTCQNRVGTDFYGTDGNLRNFEEWWTYSADPTVVDGIGSTNTMSYPPPGNFWGMEMSENDTCNTIVYEASFTWNDLVACAATTGGTSYVKTVDGPNDITLSGVFYVNVVSPYVKNANDGYYRIYQLLSQPFDIIISKSIYVLGEVGINVLSMSVIAVYKEKQENDFRLVLVTESQNYLQLSAASQGYLFNPDVNDTAVTGVISQGDFTWPTNSENSEQGDGCLNNKNFICSQLWVIEANNLDCNAEAIDFSGKYTLVFDTSCRDDVYNEHCAGDGTSENIGWLAQHPDIADGVALETHLTWRDEICNSRVFSVQFDADMQFYTNDQFTDDVNGIPDGEGAYLFQVGQDDIYVKIKTTFAQGSANIFESTLLDVWICTFPPDYVVSQPDPNTGSGGCMDGERDGPDDGTDLQLDIDNPYFYHIYKSDPIKQEEGFQEIDTSGEPEDLKFFFKVPRKIARDTLYVQAEVEVTLQSGARRRILLSNKDVKTANKIGHTIGMAGLTNTERVKNNDRPIYKPEQPQPQVPNPSTNTFVINLSSPWVIGIGSLLAMVLAFNIILMCYMNCNKQQRARVSFDTRRRSGYSSVKNRDSDFNESCTRRHEIRDVHIK